MNWRKRKRVVMDGAVNSLASSKSIRHKVARSLKQGRLLGVTVFLLIWSAFTPLLSAEEGDVRVGAWAKYKILSTYTYGGEKPPLDMVTLRVGPEERFKGKTYRWWQMECQKTGGSSFSISILSDHVPMLRRKRSILDVARYILADGEESPVEYVDAGRKIALLPRLFETWEWDFYLTPSWSSIKVGPFVAQGTLLGQMLALWEWSEEGEFPPLDELKVLKLGPGLLIGTGRNFRDNLDHRITGDEDYPYQRFTKEDYDEMIEVGINYFTVDPEQAEWIRRRPVFYEQRDLKAVRFPEILYRSNYRGAVQFVDEPACYIYGDEDAKKGAKRPGDLAELLQLRVLRTVKIDKGHYSSLCLGEALRDAGFNLGLMHIVEPDIPIWETLIQTSFYQLQSGAACGIIHEGRYRLDSFLSDLNKMGLEAEGIGAREMLLFHYAFLRGAAHAWRRDWGTSIYGQADPEVSPLAVTLAYDLGARYIWYWTSDHQHHLPYREQLELTRHLRAHQKAHPRKGRKELLRAAKVAIAIPYGYVVDFGPLWGSSDFAHERLNEAGVPYGDVVRAAVKEALECLRRGESFDFVVDSLGLRARGYERSVYVRCDGTVDITDN